MRIDGRGLAYNTIEVFDNKFSSLSIFYPLLDQIIQQEVKNIHFTSGTQSVRSDPSNAFSQE